MQVIESSTAHNYFGNVYGQGDLGMIPGEPHNEDEIHLKALPKQIFVVFFQIDKSRTTKEQLHSDPALILNVLAKYWGRQYRRRRSSLTERGESHATCSCLSECHCELSPKLFPYYGVSCMQTGTLDTDYS